jgi:hypothetical protein
MTIKSKRRKINSIRSMLKKYKPVISVALVSLTIAFAVYYLAKHHSMMKQLVHTPLYISIGILGLYTVMFGVLIVILSASINICNRKLVQKENAQLNAHSLFINFFIPGQGGPVYRGVYLYKKHKLRVKNYIMATMIYYVFYGIISSFLLLMTIVTIAAGLAGFLILKKYSGKFKLKKDSLNLSAKALLYLFLATLTQTLLQAFIYGVELHTVNSHIGVTQVLTYTGAANLALFVGLTPGAIGIRESFLIFTRHLNHISSANIILANVIDRSVYFVFLILLLIATIALQLRGKSRAKSLSMAFREAFGLSTATSK